MKGKVKILDQVDVEMTQEGTIIGELKPGECRYMIISRLTGVFLVIVKMNKNGRITVVDRKIGGRTGGW